MLNIAIDGPSGAGKSTIGKMLAERLGVAYLDTGAMYRAVALYAIRAGVDVNNPQEVVPLLDSIKIDFLHRGDGDAVLLCGEDVSADIRRHEISKAASDVSKIPQVRLFLVDMQRAIAAQCDVVLDGRDITSFVLPDAQYKFYLTASPEERARRRFEELRGRGGDLTYGQVLADIVDRDKNDMTRSFAPLVVTETAVVIDSTNMTLREVLEEILRHIKEEG